MRSISSGPLRVASTFVASTLFALGSVAAAGPATDEVNVFIGTGGSGFGAGATYPGPCVPFGMARPGPDTTSGLIDAPFHHFSGYYHPDRAIRGFSHTRLSGIGVPDYGNLAVMPTTDLDADPRDREARVSRFSHRTEEARPGYYAVTLGDTGVRVELTATQWSAVHRYTFPKGAPGRVIVDAAQAIPAKGAREAEVRYDAETGELSGRLLCHGSLTGRNGGVELFFVARLDRPIRAYGFMRTGGKPWGAFFDLDADPAGKTTVELRVALSLVSVDQARLHLAAEVGDRGFNAVRAAGEQLWEELLGRVEVEGGTPDQRAIFRTALYHAFVMPTDLTEAGGRYRGLDAKVHEAGERRYYSDFSLWDTYRTQLPLVVLLMPERASDMMWSLTRMADQGGYLPKWPTAYRYTSCMIGTSADISIADAYLKGIRGFEVETAYAAARAAALAPTRRGSGFAGRVGIADYLKLGYVPADRHGSSVSRTIEFSYADGALAALAAALGKEEDARMFAARATSYKNLWDPGSGFLRGRKASGRFVWPFLSFAWQDPYVEGNARQWLLAPLHDADGLVALMGGSKRFTARLEELFQKSRAQPDTLLPDVWYWHGNEPDIHAAYLFNYVGRPDLTQRWVRWVMATKYANAPAGLDGNDDCGTLSAWYVWSALGIYPVAGSARYLVGSPLFDKVVLRRKEGDLTITAKGGPTKSPYVKTVSFGDAPLDRPWFDHPQIGAGADLRFEMSGAPSAWGRKR